MKKSDMVCEITHQSETYQIEYKGKFYMIVWEWDDNPPSSSTYLYDDKDHEIPMTNPIWNEIVNIWVDLCDKKG